MLIRLIVCVLSAVTLAAGVRAQPRPLDDFSDLSKWKVIASDGVKASIAPAKDGESPALRLNFDFQAGAGYCIVHRDIALDLPRDYRFSFDVRGEGVPGDPAPKNNLEFKLVDPTGDNVWWVNRRTFEFPTEWRTIRDRARHFSFAWGPSRGARLEHTGAIEFAISAAEGGRGSVELSRLTFEPLEEPTGPPPAMQVSASSGFHAVSMALAQGSPLRWRSAPDDASPWIELDLGRDREFGGLVIDWDAKDYAIDYDVMTAGAAPDAPWETVASMRGCRGGRNWVPVRDGEAGKLRIQSKKASRDHGVSVIDIAVKEPDFDASDTAVFAAIAADTPRRRMPRYFSGEQAYWTVVGVPGGQTKALLGADGAVEPAARAFSIEPMVVDRGGRAPQLFTWEDVRVSQRLERGSLPIPTVVWDAGEWTLEVTACGVGNAANDGALVRYKLTNAADRAATLRLALVVRPFQVLPPWQDLNITGGVSRISKIARDGDALVVDGASGKRRVDLWMPPTAFGASPFARGDVVNDLATGALPTEQSVDDPMGFASGAAVYDVKLGSGQSATFVIDVPLDGAGAPAHPEAGSDIAALVDQQIAGAAEAWDADLNRVRLSLPSDAPGATQLADSFRAAQGQILVGRAGPAIRPGARNYARSWIRDGSLACAALLATGHAEEARDFIDWYAEHQYPSGKVPCVVDKRGADPVDEHDSTGEYIFAVRTCEAFTGDKAFLNRHLPRVELGVGYLESLRARRMTAEYASGPDAKRACYGLVPESISHEGYSAKPMHSYWDSFWTLEGLKDAAWLEERAGRTEQATRIAADRDAYRRSLFDSVSLATRLRGIDFMPGCVELGDFDATSTAVAAYPCGELDGPLSARLRRTFEEYADFFRQRRSGGWSAYTPYELRLVGTFVRLGEPEQANQMLEFFFQGQRPGAWRQWAEVVWHDPATPRFIGDMPHTWVASEYINAVRSMLVYEREHDAGLVLAAGVPPEWLNGAGMSVGNLPTEFGPVSYTFRRRGQRLEMELSGPERFPGHGLTVVAPGKETIASISVDGKRARADEGRRIAITAPARSIIIQLAEPDR